jgi:hypothetical protein
MVSETSSAEVYEQIFAGIRDSRDLAQAIARAVRELREAMEKEDSSDGVCAGREDVHLLAYSRADTRAGGMVGGDQKQGWPAMGVFVPGEAWCGRTAARRRGEIRRGRHRPQSVAGARSGHSRASDTSGDRSGAGGTGQRISETGFAVCKSTPQRQGVGGI